MSDTVAALARTAKSRVQPNAPWWLAENGLRVLKRRYLQKNTEGVYVEDADGLLKRVCENFAHIDALWAVYKHDHKTLRTERPDQLADADLQALKLLDEQKQWGWNTATLQTYERTFRDAYGRYRREIDEGLYLPATPILINSNARTGMLYSCFVIPMDDTLMRRDGDPEDVCGILDCAKAVVAVQRSGGGTGMTVSRTRPRDSAIFCGKRQQGVVFGQTRGSVGWLHLVSDNVRHIEQGSARHGANMGILRIDHPDIIEFITEKNGYVLTNFNISVGMTDEFIKLLEASPDKVWRVLNPYTGEHEDCVDKLGRVKDAAEPWTVREVWDLIVRRAWERGDPGLWFIDRVNATNPTPNLGQFEACNPCVTEDTWVQTEDGPMLVRDLVDRPTTLLVNGERVNSETGFFYTATRGVGELRTKEGYKVRLTPDHRVMRVIRKGRAVWGGTEWVEARNLQPGDKIAIHDHRDRSGWPGSGIPDHGYLLGYLLGDGTIKEQGAVLSVWGADDDAESLVMALEKAANSVHQRADAGSFGQPIAERNERRMQLMGLREIASDYGMWEGSKRPDERIEQTSAQFHCAFLKGLFDADGSVQGNREKGVSVRLPQSDIETLEMCQRMLLRLGIASTIYRERRPAQSRPLPDGKGGMKDYDCKAQHELVISGVDMQFFFNRIGFEHAGKQMKLQGALEGYRRALNGEHFVATFESFDEVVGEHEVYDIQVPGLHAFDGNGLMLHNCGEQELLPNESCNLGSLVLSRFVEATGGEPPARIDWARMERTIRTAVRAHDAVIDANIYTPEVPAIRKATKATRKIGLGVMGWWDMLVRLGIPYESEEALLLADQVMRFINSRARAESEALAEERGVFPAWKGSREQELGHKVRNATRTTIAPTGTISIIMDVTGGIEPAFGLAFLRTSPGIGDDIEEINTTFQEWLASAVTSGRMTKAEARQIVEDAFHGKSVSEHPLLSEEERRLFRVANEIPVEWHIKHQAAFQKHTDNSVSKTINAHRDATVEDIDSAYRMAINHGLNGITVFRDGCLEDTGQKQPMAYKKESVAETIAASTEVASLVEKAQFTMPPKPSRVRPLRPQIGISMKSLFGMVHLHITVDPRADRELEVFGCVGKAGELKLAQMEGMGRLISQILRLGADLELVVSQLKGIGSKHTTLSSGGRHLSLEDTVGHMLAKYLEAKKRWGMKAMLLGEIGEDELLAFIAAPLEDKQALMNAFWNGNGNGTTQPDTDALAKAAAANTHGITCDRCKAEIVMVGGCAVCLGCGDSSC